MNRSEKYPFYWPNINDPSGDNSLTEDSCIIYDGLTEVIENEYYCTDYGNTNLDDYFGQNSNYYLGTDGDENYQCYNINAENCFMNTEIGFYGESLSQDWDGDGIYTTPGTYIDEDELWAWRDYCEENEIYDENECNEWINMEISDICEECTELRIKGEPAINRIEYVMVGVVNNGNQTVYGSVWLNELRNIEFLSYYISILRLLLNNYNLKIIYIFKL